MAIARNIMQIQQNIAAAVQRSTVQSPCAAIKLIAVTKHQDLAVMRQVIDSGVAAIGENRVQEAVRKFPVLERAAERHLIGHLQTNKVRQAVPIVDLIQSVDSQRLALEIDRIAGMVGKRQDVLLQVNVAGETGKFGITPQELIPLAAFVSQLEHVRLCGLMMIAPHYENVELVRPIFRELYLLFSELQAINIYNASIQWLSMGMTGDYTVAVEEGANMVRVGTGIFGARHYHQGGTP